MSDNRCLAASSRTPEMHGRVYVIQHKILVLKMWRWNLLRFIQGDTVSWGPTLTLSQEIIPHRSWKMELGHNFLMTVHFLYSIFFFGIEIFENLNYSIYSSLGNCKIWEKGNGQPWGKFISTLHDIIFL